ncbi:hypothetical protein R1X32_11895 [Rhodococcus opacus]
MTNNRVAAVEQRSIVVAALSLHGSPWLTSAHEPPRPCSRR